LNLIHNSINIVSSTQPVAGLTSARCFAFGITGAANTGTFNVKNNILVNGQAGGVAMNVQPTSVTLSLAGNVYFTQDSKSVVRAGLADLSMAQWQANGNDATSGFADPRVPNAPASGHWHLAGAGLNDLHFTAIPGSAFLKAPLAGYTTDIDGEARGVIAALAGADEIKDADADGLPTAFEDVAGGDGNGDSIPDRDQPQVLSFPAGAELRAVTLVASAGVFSNSGPQLNPSPVDAPANRTFPLGFMGFELVGLTSGASATVTMILPSGTGLNAVYKYGRTPTNPTNHWYKFDFDGTTGAVITGSTVVLHFVDGTRGDDDLVANGTIVDPFGPAIDTSATQDWMAY
jgi:hypothetical protein